jgi:hypothetical protein
MEWWKIIGIVVLVIVIVTYLDCAGYIPKEYSPVRLHRRWHHWISTLPSGCNEESKEGYTLVTPDVSKGVKELLKTLSDQSWGGNTEQEYGYVVVYGRDKVWYAPPKNKPNEIDWYTGSSLRIVAGQRPDRQGIWTGGKDMKVESASKDSNGSIELSVQPWDYFFRQPAVYKAKVDKVPIIMADKTEVRVLDDMTLQLTKTQEMIEKGL